MSEDEKKVQAVSSTQYAAEGTLHDVKVNLNDADVAMKLAFESQGIVIDKETNRKLLRKIDLYVTPLMCLVYAIQFMDKLSNSYASIMGLRTDLNMVGSQYSWTGTAFYLGYLAFSFPAAILLQRYNVARTCAVFVVLWGFILCMSSVPNNFAGFIATRTVLGILESAVTPAFVLLTAQWYKREEQFLRTSLWLSFNGLGTIIGALTAYGLAKDQTAGTLPMDGWRLLFVIIGVITIAFGIGFAFHIPGTPSQAWFLNEIERLQVVERIRSNMQGFGNHHFKWYQFREVFVDIRTYILFFFMIAVDIPNGGITNFGSIMLTSMGYDAHKALLMGTPQGAVELVGCILFGLAVQYTQKRMLVAIFGSFVNLLSGCLLAFPKSTKAQLAGYYLFGVSPVPFICVLSLVASNTAGHTKKIITGAVVLIGYCVGNLIGPQTFIASQAPSYTGAKIAIVVCYAVGIVLLILLYFVNVRANKLRDERDEKLPEEIENPEFADLTDFENPEFRYSV